MKKNNKRKATAPQRRKQKSKSRHKRKRKSEFTLSADISGSFDLSKYRKVSKDEYRKQCIDLYGQREGSNIPDRCRCGASKCVCSGQQHYIYLTPKPSYKNLLPLVLEKSEINGSNKEKYSKFKSDYSDLSKYKEVTKSEYREYCVRLYGKKGKDIPDRCRCGKSGNSDTKCSCNATDLYLYFIPLHPLAHISKTEPFVCDKREAEKTLALMSNTSKSKSASICQKSTNSTVSNSESKPN